ncbi:hypothetical protein BLNAU_19977 [Blattamonas nauphoetae]|uniref:Uncharacterized protein n=2 Tax=Blattamonas nauphoetae TaxID=2049346 RepID=A0ABQ9X037_9EUKA|nr:hypothetical protein BLNAU_19977 [Blattamonas nauphoetae]
MTPAWWEVILHHAVQTGIECSNRRCLHADWNDCTNRNPSIDSADQNTESTHDTLSFGTDCEITVRKIAKIKTIVDETRRLLDSS